MNRATGRLLAPEAELGQRVADVLTTPIGTRVMRRDYGSNLPTLIDAPGNLVTRQRLIAATATALARWIPELTVRQVTLNAEGARWEIAIAGSTAGAGGAAEAFATSVPLGGA